MTTFFYPYLKRASLVDGQELVWSINSVTKNVTNCEKRFVIIGDALPQQLIGKSNIKFIHWSSKEQQQQPSTDVLYKIVSFIKQYDSVEPFILMNDDYIINKPIDISTLLTTYYYDGTLQERWLKNNDATNYYYKKIINTKDYLDSFALPTLNYAVHFPLPIFPKVLHNVLTLINHDIKNNEHLKIDTLLFRPIYTNYLKKFKNQLISEENLARLKFVAKKDVKYRSYQNLIAFKQTIEGQNMFSLGDDVLSNKDIVRYLNKMYNV